jgi:hypothetical protein
MDNKHNNPKIVLIFGLLALTIVTTTLIIIFEKNTTYGNENTIYGKVDHLKDMENCQYWSSSAETLENVSQIICLSPSHGTVAIVVNLEKTHVRCVVSHNDQKYVDIDLPRTLNQNMNFSISNTHVLIAEKNILSLYEIDLEKDITWSSQEIRTKTTTADIIGIWFLQNFIVLTNDFEIFLYHENILTFITKIKINGRFDVFDNQVSKLCFWNNSILQIVDTVNFELMIWSPPGLTIDNVLQITLSPDGNTLAACVINNEDTTVRIWENDFNLAPIYDFNDPAPWQSRFGFGMFAFDTAMIIPSQNVETKKTTFTAFRKKYFLNRQLEIDTTKILPLELLKFAKNIRSIDDDVIAIVVDFSIIRFIRIIHSTF